MISIDVGITEEQLNELVEKVKAYAEGQQADFTGQAMATFEPARDPFKLALAVWWEY